MRITRHQIVRHDISGLSDHEYSCIQAALMVIAHPEESGGKAPFPEYRETAVKLLADMHPDKEETEVPSRGSPEPVQAAGLSPATPVARMSDPNDEVVNPISSDDPRPRAAAPAPGPAVFRRKS